MRYEIVHVTEYAYGEPVPLCHNVARLQPRDTERQTCLRHELTITPSPALLRKQSDFFGNPVAAFSVQNPHLVLSVTARSEVEVTPASAPSGLFPMSWEEAVGVLSSGRDPDARIARQYVFESPQIRHDPALADYARASFQPGRPLTEALLDLTKRIHEEFQFTKGCTSVGTPVMEVFRTRQGVCQDFAHLQIGCLRSIGLAARYVSGYIVTEPPPGQARQPGADASHAWVSAYVPGSGWLDLDPTQGRMADTDHITVAWARDYDDVAPLKGILLGGQQQSLRVAVDVVPLSDGDVSAT
ncbi:MAG TPA: transglutaminase family protein [Planctomycetota bacterium]|nr:transglutaminase family protein [Planctomycetota bacterium]